jgi:hypothetical protein
LILRNTGNNGAKNFQNGRVGRLLFRSDRDGIGVLEVSEARLQFGILGIEGDCLLFGLEGFRGLSVEEKSFGEGIEDCGDRLRRSLNGMSGKPESFGWLSKIGIISCGVNPGQLIFRAGEVGGCNWRTASEGGPYKGTARAPFENVG